MPSFRPVRGASLVECVVVFPVALLLVLGIVQCGLLAWGKLTLNHLAFLAARHGALHHADTEAITAAVVRGLIPFHQDSRQGDDARRLLDSGYRLASLNGFDLFPNTPHVETIGVFQR